MSRFQNIESVDGGYVPYDAAEEDEADAMNADTFGEDAVEEFKGSGFFDLAEEKGFFDIPSDPVPTVGKSISLDVLFGKKAEPGPLAPPPGLEAPPPASHFDKLMGLGPKLPVDRFSPAIQITPPPPPPMMAVPPPPPPPPMRPPSPMASMIGAPPQPPTMSIHVFPVRVFPTPFTARQRAQALSGQLDVHKWGKQEEFIREQSLMTARDKEFVTKIQLNQMVALSGSTSQNYRGQFTFGRSTSSAVPAGTAEESSALGKRLYASVHHPRKLVTVEPQAAAKPSQISEKRAREVAEECLDLLIDVADVDEYISTLHPLAEEKINEAIIERTEFLEKITNLLISVPGGGKLGKARKRTIDMIVELVQPPATVTSEAQARRSLIFRRVPESVQGFYIDLLEKIVEQ